MAHMADEQYEQILTAIDEGYLTNPDNYSVVDKTQTPHKTLDLILAATGARSAEEAIALAAGRPRAEDSTARSTWRIRTTEELDQRVSRRAEDENLPKSALIRKAVDYYLVNA